MPCLLIFSLISLAKIKDYLFFFFKELKLKEQRSPHCVDKCWSDLSWLWAVNETHFICRCCFWRTNRAQAVGGENENSAHALAPWHSGPAEFSGVKYEWETQPCRLSFLESDDVCDSDEKYRSVTEEWSVSASDCRASNTPRIKCSKSEESDFSCSQEVSAELRSSTETLDLIISHWSELYLKKLFLLNLFSNLSKSKLILLWKVLTVKTVCERWSVAAVRAYFQSSNLLFH